MRFLLWLQYHKLSLFHLIQADYERSSLLISILIQIQNKDTHPAIEHFVVKSIYNSCLVQQILSWATTMIIIFKKDQKKPPTTPGQVWHTEPAHMNYYRFFCKQSLQTQARATPLQYTHANLQTMPSCCHDTTIVASQVSQMTNEKISQCSWTSVQISLVPQQLEFHVCQPNAACCSKWIFGSIIMFR